jgi:hypothetical protein
MKNLIIRERQRKLPKYYNWLDHKLVHQGYLKKLSANSCAFYLFLLTVGDRDGMSYYSEKAIAQRVGNDVDIVSARAELMNHDLLAYCAPFYQVLSLPEIIVRSNEALTTAPEVKKLLNDFLGGA